MQERIARSKYKDIAAVTMESEKLSVTFLPEYGGKMASLAHKGTAAEFMAQASGAEYKVLQYDGSYVDSECSGFDDMFPTIDSVHYDRYPWKGVMIPDHGEVCSLKWDCDIEDGCLSMGVYGVRFPYRLEKRVRFKDSSTLVIDYKAINLSEFDMDFIWAAHTMIKAEEGGKVTVPYKDGSMSTCVFSADAGFGARGWQMKWPEAARKDGKVQRLDTTPARDTNGNSYKIYFNEPAPEGWCTYECPSTGLTLKMSFPKEKVPYFSIWMNEGSFNGLYNIAFEPCTGAYDRIDVAKLYSQNSVLKAGSEYAWFLEFCIA